MPAKRVRVAREQLGVRISPEAMEMLAKLQDHWTGDSLTRTSQSEATDKAIKCCFAAEGLGSTSKHKGSK